MENASHTDRNGSLLKHRRLVLIALAILVLIGAGLRFYNLGGKALWLDEIFTLVRTQDAGPAEILERVRTNERHPPLFHLLSAPFLRPGHGDAAVRLLPALASTLTVLLTGLLGRRCFGPAAGLAAAGLAAFSSFEVTVAQEGRPAALATLLLLASTLALHRSVFGEQNRSTVWAAVAYGILVALSLHTYYYAVYMVAAQLIFLLGLGAVKARRIDGFGPVRAFLQEGRWPVFLAGAIGGLLVLPWALHARESLLRFSSMASAKETVNYSPLAAVDYFRSICIHPLKFSAGWINLSIGALVLVLLIASLLVHRRQHRRQLVLPGMLIALPLAAVLISPFKPELFQPRHLAFLTPILFILLARLLTRLRPRLVAALLGVVFLSLNIFALQLYFDPGYRKSAVRECTAAITASARPGDAVLFNPAFASHSFERYEAGVPLPKIIVYPSQFDSLRGELRRYRRVWLVEYHGATFGPLPSYGATLGRVMNAAGGRRTFAGINEAITVSLHVKPGARRQGK